MKFLGKLLLYIGGINNENLDFKVIKLIFLEACLQWTSLYIQTHLPSPYSRSLERKKEVSF